MYRIIVLVLNLFFSVCVFAGKYAIIYTELPGDITIKNTNDRYDPKLMEKAWKATFLKWEKLYRTEKYKLDHISVLYADGIDYSCTIYGTRLDLRYSPHQYGIDYICYKRNPANRDNLEIITNSLKGSLKSEDELNIFKYDLETNIFIKSK